MTFRTLNIPCTIASPKNPEQEIHGLLSIQYDGGDPTIESMKQEIGMQKDGRWEQRFQNFDRVALLLREPFDRDINTLSALEKEGIISAFRIHGGAGLENT